MPHRSMTLLLLLASLALALFALPVLARKPTPITVTKLVTPDSTSSAYGGDAGPLVLNLLGEIKANAEHYGEQASNYDSALLAMRLVALICSITAAAVLVLSGAEWARRAAVMASIFAAAVPAADQVFQVSDMNRASWRAAVDSARIFLECKTTWELRSFGESATDRTELAKSLVAACRERLAKVVDLEMDTSLRSLQMPAKIEPK